MDDVIWKVTVKKAWWSLEFEFDVADEAETFAYDLRDHYIPDKDKFSITVSAVFAQDVTAEKEEQTE